MDNKRIAYTLSLLARAMKKGKELELKKQPPPQPKPPKPTPQHFEQMEFCRWESKSVVRDELLT